RPDDARVDRWRQRLPSDDTLKVGIAWAGRAIPSPRRSIPPAVLTHLKEVGGVTFISLQKDRVADSSLDLLDWTREWNDLADTAAVVQNLDLVITIDSAVAHLAGALGKPVWVLLERVADWRWLLDRTDSPWYPTARLFRQPQIGDWESPVKQVAAEL